MKLRELQKLNKVEALKAINLIAEITSYRSKLDEANFAELRQRIGFLSQKKALYETFLGIAAINAELEILDKDSPHAITKQAELERKQEFCLLNKIKADLMQAFKDKKDSFTEEDKATLKELKETKFLGQEPDKVIQRDRLQLKYEIFQRFEQITSLENQLSNVAQDSQAFVDISQQLAKLNEFSRSEAELAKAYNDFGENTDKFTVAEQDELNHIRLSLNEKDQVVRIGIPQYVDNHQRIFGTDPRAVDRISSPNWWYVSEFIEFTLQQIFINKQSELASSAASSNLLDQVKIRPCFSTNDTALEFENLTRFEIIPYNITSGMSGTHWVTILVDHKIKKITCLDSMGSAENEGQVKQAISGISEYDFSYISGDYQKDNHNCGVHMCNAISEIIKTIAGLSIDKLTSNEELIKLNEIAKIIGAADLVTPEALLANRISYFAVFNENLKLFSKLLKLNLGQQVTSLSSGKNCVTPGSEDDDEKSEPIAGSAKSAATIDRVPAKNTIGPDSGIFELTKQIFVKLGENIANIKLTKWSATSAALMLAGLILLPQVASALGIAEYIAAAANLINSVPYVGSAIAALSMPINWLCGVYSSSAAFFGLGIAASIESHNSSEKGQSSSLSNEEHKSSIHAKALEEGKAEQAQRART